MSHPPLFGLLLYGEGIRETDYTAFELSSFCDRNIVAVRKYPEEKVPPGFLQLFDAFPDWGPLGSLITAMQAFPEAAFLMVAADLPFAVEEAFIRLLDGRDPAKSATAFLNPEQGGPDPLCALYEPGFYFAAMEAAARGERSLGNILASANPALVPSPSGRLVYS